MHHNFISYILLKLGITKFQMLGLNNETQQQQIAVTYARLFLVEHVLFWLLVIVPLTT